MLRIGQYNKLKILNQKKTGLMLQDDSGETVLLPQRVAPENSKPDDEIDVFIYSDHQGRKAATTKHPKILLHEFAFLKVAAVTEIGVFMDWGLDKELFVPFGEQKQRMAEGRWYIVYLDYDKKTDRLFASNRVGRYLNNEILTIKEGDKVGLLVQQKTDLGFSVIINHTHRGLIFENEIFRKLNIGDQLDGYVKKIHADHKIDISIQPIGYTRTIDVNTDLICQVLLKNNRTLPITDKSAPDEISLQFHMSKKAFKKALGALYKQRKIEIHPDGIELL